MQMNYRKYPVERMNVNINMEQTGELIRQSVAKSGYSIKEIMTITGITSEQAIYKWFRGESIPSTENQIILCKLFGVQLTELIVVDEPSDGPRENDSGEISYKGEYERRSDMVKRLIRYWAALQKICQG